MKKILDTIFSDNGEFVVRFLFAVIFMIFFTGNLFGQMTETDKEITKQEQRDKRADYREFMIEKQKEYNKIQGQQQIKKMIIEKERKRKFMKRKIKREKIKSFILGIGIGYVIGDNK